MKLFECTYCGQLLQFENTRCEKCGHELGFLPEELQLFPLIEEKGVYSLYNHQTERRYRYCDNHAYGVCNWLVDDNLPARFCTACSLNQTIPDLNKTEYRQRWSVIEAAKHRLIYTLLSMKLPILSKETDPEKGLSFDFMADEQNSEQKIMTGHDNGLITLNIAEADDVEREMARRSMAEPYRTVLGHFRHEIGHYYWDRLIDGTSNLEPYRKLFGDEQEDYGEALKKHYKEGAPADWNEHFISTYASTHSWEDWAETWAHYLHILDTLETAYAFGLSIKPGIVHDPSGLSAIIKADPFRLENFDDIISMWLPLVFAMNSINRSMGLPDLYPFVIPVQVIEKLKFIHGVCLRARQEGARGEQNSRAEALQS
ncbi:MAG: putative zinc-binding peptidase [Williamsia sp.]|nr:putative zinc-binding peptidase [Williamsia sp.]